MQGQKPLLAVSPWRSWRSWRLGVVGGWSSELNRQDAKDAKRKERLAISALLAWCCLLFGYGLFTGDLYRNETLRAYLAKECLARGDFIVPHLYGEPLLTKPPGMYVFIALCSLPFGEVTAASARLPSVLMATASVLGLYVIARSYVESRQAAWLAALAPCFVLWLAKVPSAEMDVVQVGWVVLTLACWHTASRARSASKAGLASAAGSARETVWWLLGSLCLAAGILTKWTAGIYVYATLLPWLWWRGNLRLLFSRAHLLAVALVTALVAGWIAAVIQQVGWETLWRQVLAEAAPRLLPGQHLEEHPDKHLLVETLLHPFKVLACTLPLGPLALLTLLPGWWRRQSPSVRSLALFLHCWAWPNLLLFTLLPEHASRHSLPFCLAITGLAALWLVTSRWQRWLPAFLLAWFVVKVGYIEIVVPRRDEGRQPAAKAQVLAKAIPEGQVVYLNQLKDEGLAFYLGRPVRRVRDGSALPTDARFVLLTDAEWRSWQAVSPRAIVAARHFKDTQNDPIVLVELRP